MRKQLTIVLLLFAGVNAFAQVPNYVPTNGLVGYWPFNGNANDESGNGNNGTVNGATLTADRFGNANKAYSFDGVNDYISNPTSGLPYGNANRTINCWIMNNDNFSGWSHTILSYGSASQGNAVMPAVGNNNALAVQGWIDDFPTNVQSINYSWHMMTFTLDNGIGKIYYDGVQIATQSVSQWNTIQSAFLIGVRIDIQNSFYLGKIDDIGIWNRALTQQEITNLHTSSVPSTCSISASATTACTGTSVNLQFQSNVPTSDTIVVPSILTDPLIQGSVFEYSTTLPVSGWQTQTGGWLTGNLPFIGYTTGTAPGATNWPLGSTRYLRKTIDLTGYNLNTIQYFVAVDNGYSLYVNGTLVNSNNQGGPATEWEYTGTIPSNLLVSGINYIAFIITDDGAGAAVFNCMFKGQPYPATYSWSPGGATTPSITVNPTQTTTYTCTVTANGQSCSSSQTIEVLQPAITATTNTICSGQSTTLTAAMPVNTACPTLNGTLTNGLVGYWPFCGNANDAGGNGNNGTVNGATLTTDRFGNANCAYSFDGVNDYISISTSTGLNLIGDFSIRSFVLLNNPSPTNPNYQHFFILSKNAGVTGNGTWHLALESNSNSPYQIHYNADPCFCSATMGGVNSQINNSNWNEVSVTYSASNNTLKYYLNGILVYTSTQFIYQNQITPYDLLIGKENIGIQGFFNGKIDDVAIWNRALTATEIQQLYNQGQTSYLWSPSGETTSSISVSPTQTTSYSCTVTNNGVSCTDDVTIVVDTPPTPVITTSGSTSICSGNSVTLTSSSVTGNVWSNGATTQAITVSTAGINNVTVTNASGCSATSANTTVTVNALPTVNAGIDQTVCAGTSITLSGSGANTYSWNNSVTNAVAFTPASTATYTVTGTNTSTGCTNTDQAVVTVNALPTVNAGIDQTLCAGTSITLSGSGANTYSWNNAVNNAVTFTPASTATYTVTGTNTTTGCTNTDQVVVTVNALPTVNAGIDQTVCAGTSVTLSGSGANTYSWNNGVNNALAFTPVSTATYTVTGTNTTTGCSNTDQAVVTVNALPTVNAGIDQTVCAGTSITLSGSGANTYLWNNGVTNAVAFTPSSITTYTVTGTNTTTGCTNTDQVVVTVNALPTVNAGIDQTVCAGTSVTLSGSGANIYSWNNAVTNAVAFIPAATATYTVTGTNTTTGCTNSDQVVVTVNALPTVNAGIDQAVCAGTSVTLSGSGATTYSWDNGVTNGVAFTPASTTTYTVTGTNTATGCTNTDQVLVTINALPTINAGIDQTVCAGTSITLSGSGANTYSWNNGVTNAVAFTPASTTTYTVTGTNTATGCTNTDQVVVTVNALPLVNGGADQSLCQGQSTTLFATGANSFSWSNNIVNGVGFLPTLSQEYIVTGTNTLTGCINSDTVSVTVNALPIVNAGADLTICKGDTILLSGSGALNYSWNNNVVNDQAFVPAATQTYQVVGTDTNNCSNNDEITVTVNDASASTLTETALDSYTLNGQTYTQSGTYTQVIPNAAGCDSTITLNLSLNFTGINETQTGFTIAPNPTMDFVTIKSTDALYDNYVLFDPQGRKVLSGSLTGTSTLLDLSRLSRGNYLLQVGVQKTPVKILKQ